MSFIIVGFECLCSEEGMGRSILGFTTVETTGYKAFKYYVWPCHGGMVSLVWP